MKTIGYSSNAKPLCHDPLKTGDAFGRIPAFAIAPIYQILTYGELKLFMYYALQADGFCPSFAEITNQTGIEKSNAKKYRKRLIAKGFIRYDTDAEARNQVIRICWDNIRKMKQEIILKSNTESTSKDRADPTSITDRVTNVGIREKTIEELIKESDNRVFIGVNHESTPLTKSERRFYNKVKKLTQSEFNEMLNATKDIQEEEPLPF